MTLSFWRATDEPDVLAPRSMARSMWSEDQMHGVAIAGALARAAEHALTAEGRGDLRPARMTVDLFKAVRMRPARLTTEVVRVGPRLCLIDVVLFQDEDGSQVPKARAGVLFVKPSEAPAGRVWESDDRPTPPPLETVPASEEPRVPFFSSDAEWSDDFGQHQNAGRKQTWQTGVPIVEGEEATPFETVAAIADATSLVTNWGDKGVEFINTDITLTLARLPITREVGLRAVDHVEDDGIAVGTATVFDREGVIGACVVTAISNAKRQVDFERVEFAGDGSRRRV